MDYDEMRSLEFLFEIVEEDLALCEFVDVSKHQLQGTVGKERYIRINPYSLIHMKFLRDLMTSKPTSFRG